MPAVQFAHLKNVRLGKKVIASRQNVHRPVFKLVTPEKNGRLFAYAVNIAGVVIYLLGNEQKNPPP